MSHRSKNQARSWKERAMSLVLAAVLLLGTVPGLTLPSSAHWADEYLDKMVDWGVMRADQTRNPDTPVTRAEFAGVINRAYGYTETGPIPFEDVDVADWFYDDIRIAYTAGYMAGTSPTTASPNDTLTREMAVCILGRNMMMKETPGESLAFTDSRDISAWAHGIVKTAVDNYVISGYPDNSFGPQDAISRAQMAVLVSQCVGSPVSESGDYALGGVFGNVTITAPNVTLRDTTISGDLYISGGVGLGGIRLENVNVLGRIIVSGTGESEAGDASVVMRNVTANEMLVDNMRNKTVTVRADGITDIAKTVVRTNAYLEDNNTDDKGLMSIELDGESGTRLTLAGRIKEVVDKTPNSYVQVGKGTVAKLTVDEAAINSTVQLDRNTEVKEMNLDVAANVTGEGDIEKLNVNAPGSVVAMLPDDIYIRPGLTASIAGVIMDHQAAEEGSLDPRLLSGYPAAKDVAPTGFRADFAGNKKGTVYWAVSSITDGSIDEEDLVNPPSYGSKAIQNGSIAAPVGGDEVSAQVANLTVGGSYYLSAILVDDQGKRSPVKVISFTTPDNTVPAFGQGFPYMSFIGKEYPTDAFITAQATVLPTKSCRLYYAVLPQGAAVPTSNELKSAAVSGNLGYGVVDVTKNEELPIIVSRRLEELKDYVLYLWLTDIDGVNSSAVIPLAFRTPDVTPPTFVVDPYVKDVKAQSVGLGATLDENGTIFWAVVESGTDYPKPNAQNPADNTADGKTALLDSDYAKLQLANGMNALVSGRVTATGNTEATINVTGLSAEKAYDFYYMAQDTAGNYTIQVYKLLGGLHTLDNTGPVVRQFFTKYSGLDEAKDPMNDTDIVFEFSENICLTEANGQDLLTLYQNTTDPTLSDSDRQSALFSLKEAMKVSFVMYQRVSGIGAQRVTDYDTDQTNWVIDYSKVQVKNADGKLQVIFPSGGLQLASGGSYYFEISNITDNSLAKNPISPTTVKDDTASTSAGHSVPEFTVAFARINLTQFTLSNSSTNNQWPQAVIDDTRGYRVNYTFRMIPDATSTVEDGQAYDLLLWTDSAMEYDLYYRVWSTETNGQVTAQYPMPNMPSGTGNPDGQGWVNLGTSDRIYNNGRELTGRSLHTQFNKCASGNFPDINKLIDSGKIYYEFAIVIKALGDGNTREDPTTWSGTVNMYVNAAAGTSDNLYTLGRNCQSEAAWISFVNNGPNRGVGGYSVGAADNPDDPKRLAMSTNFVDSAQPKFATNFPRFEPESDQVTMYLNLNREGTVYYAIAKADTTGLELPDETKWMPDITTTINYNNPNASPPINYNDQTVLPSYVPESGAQLAAWEGQGITLEVVYPDKGNIFNPSTWEDKSQAITGTVDSQGVSSMDELVEDLDPDTTYYAYFVITGSANQPSEVYLFKFKTKPTPRPIITLTPRNTTTRKGVDMTTTNMNSYISYVVYPRDELNKFYRMLTGTTSSVQSNRLDDILNTDYYTDGTGTNKAQNLLPNAYKNYTILQALTTKYSYSQASVGNGSDEVYFPSNDDSYNGYSVFDIYASPEAKETFRAWFSGSGNVPVEIEYSGSTLPQDGDHDVNIPITQNVQTLGGSRVFAGAEYIMLAVARSRDSAVDDSADLTCSFLATSYRISDLDPPVLTMVTGSLTAGTSGTVNGGSITLHFDKALYYNDTTTTPNEIRPVDGAHFFTSTPRGLGTINVNNSPTGSTVTIQLDTSSNVANISGIVGTGHLMNAGGIPAPQVLEIRGETTTPGTGMVQGAVWCINVYWNGVVIANCPIMNSAQIQTTPTP